MNKEKVIEELFSLGRVYKDSHMLTYSFISGLVFSTITLLEIINKSPIQSVLALSILGMLVSLISINLITTKAKLAIQLYILNNSDTDEEVEFARKLKSFSLVGRIVRVLYCFLNVLFFAVAFIKLFWRVG